MDCDLLLEIYSYSPSKYFICRCLNRQLNSEGSRLSALDFGRYFAWFIDPEKFLEASNIETSNHTTSYHPGRLYNCKGRYVTKKGLLKIRMELKFDVYYNSEYFSRKYPGFIEFRRKYSGNAYLYLCPTFKLFVDLLKK